MGAMEYAILSQVIQLEAKVDRALSTPSSEFVAQSSVPAGLTLRQTITASSTPTKTGWPEWVYVVAVGGGGSGCRVDGSTGFGGGGGACFQGWMKSASISAVTIGAGGAVSSTSVGNDGSPTIIGALRVPGGSGATNAATPKPAEPGAGRGAFAGDPSTLDIMVARELFTGGRPNENGTSGGGGATSSKAGDGLAGPGGGSGYYTSASGKSFSPNGTTYITSDGGNTRGGNGGAGILGAGFPPNSSGGGNGGLGGGGGGGGVASYPSGKGGDGAVLIYY